MCASRNWASSRGCVTNCATTKNSVSRCCCLNHNPALRSLRQKDREHEILRDYTVRTPLLFFTPGFQFGETTPLHSTSLANCSCTLGPVDPVVGPPQKPLRMRDLSRNLPTVGHGTPRLVPLSWLLGLSLFFPEPTSLNW